MQAQWTALILAGQRPGSDPLAVHFGEQWKALVPIAGAAMLTHVVRCLRKCPEIGRIVVLAQEPSKLTDAAGAAGGVDQILESGPSISGSISKVLDEGTLPFPVLITTADHPLLTPEMVAQFISDVGNADLAVAMVEKDNLLNHFPNSKRTWLKFSDGHWSGANLFALAHPNVRSALDLWVGAEKDRKIPWKLFRHFGVWLMLRALTRTIGLAQALQLAGNRLGLSARLVPMHDPVAAIDVDKPADHAIAEEILAARSLASAD
ncbi:NTP transferase domain-containing protein [Sphingorhabdus sp.]|uniref:NTP transferase domain-containing protein n=1 Tax=Sphingorhabdus sp. TaxID=1902408 RepID=UPI003CC6D449